MRVGNNVNLICSLLAQKRVSYIDLSRTLASEEFSWWQSEFYYLWPNEHLRESGKLYVAKKVYEKIVEDGLLYQFH